MFKTKPDGWRPGQDIAGIIVKPGAAESSLPVGTRVVALLDGAGWAERVAVPLHRMARIPDEVSFEDAAALPVAGITALRTLRFGDSLLGRNVLIVGATGGVGNLAVQLAARSGARVTAIAKSGHAVTLHELGSAEVLESVEECDGNFHLILESVGGASFEAALRRLEAGGVIVSFGNSSGGDVQFLVQRLLLLPKCKDPDFLFLQLGSGRSVPSGSFAPAFVCAAGFAEAPHR